MTIWLQGIDFAISCIQVAWASMSHLLTANTAQDCISQLLSFQPFHFVLPLHRRGRSLQKENTQSIDDAKQNRTNQITRRIEDRNLWVALRTLFEHYLHSSKIYTLNTWLIRPPRQSDVSGSPWCAVKILLQFYTITGFAIKRKAKEYSQKSTPHNFKFLKHFYQLSRMQGLRIQPMTCRFSAAAWFLSRSFPAITSLHSLPIVNPSAAPDRGVRGQCSPGRRRARTNQPIK